ncbi:hypothetical protein BC834DRAFT_589762 [Gloeopeniophorella convolvens]|nr:hypothetical protein BC834DRAFT_589762 [Gloeopeniophorella convolvens]
MMQAAGAGLLPLLARGGRVTWPVGAHAAAKRDRGAWSLVLRRWGRCRCGVTCVRAFCGAAIERGRRWGFISSRNSTAPAPERARFEKRARVAGRCPGQRRNSTRRGRPDRPRFLARRYPDDDGPASFNYSAHRGQKVCVVQRPSRCAVRGPQGCLRCISLRAAFLRGHGPQARRGARTEGAAVGPSTVGECRARARCAAHHVRAGRAQNEASPGHSSLRAYVRCVTRAFWKGARASGGAPRGAVRALEGRALLASCSEQRGGRWGHRWVGGRKQATTYSHLSKGEERVSLRACAAATTSRAPDRGARACGAAGRLVRVCAYGCRKDVSICRGRRLQRGATDRYVRAWPGVASGVFLAALRVTRCPAQ